MDNMKQIAAALVEAQKAFGPALKTRSNPHLKSKYADLGACIEAVIDALNENGIMLTQPTISREDGVLVETVFLHESGERYKAGELYLPASKKDAQGFGSALTYARRYSLMAACGIAPEDDDGERARVAKAEEKLADFPGADDIRKAASQGGEALKKAHKFYASEDGFKAWWLANADAMKRIAAESDEVAA